MCIHFYELKKSDFASTYFCEWQEKFLPQEKRIRKRQLNQGISG